VRVYAEVARRTFQRQTTYRGATLAGLFTNTVFGFILAYVLIAVYQSRPDINGTDVGDAVTFTFLAQALAMPVGIFGSEQELSQRIRTGDVVIDLYRPIDLHGYWGAVDAGKAAFYLIFRGIVPFVAGWLVFPQMKLPASLPQFGAFLVSVALAVTVASGYRFIVQGSAFWLLDVRGANQLAWVTANFFSGMIVPLFLFPAWLATVARFLPFPSMIQVPNDIFLGRTSGMGAVGALAGQVAWALVLAGGARLVLARATRRVVIQGG
jgi:ABC-2 type transport system permease protein